MNGLRWLSYRLPISAVTRSVAKEMLRQPRRVTAYLLLLGVAALFGSGKFLLLNRLVEAGVQSSLGAVGWLLTATVVCWILAQLAVYACSAVGMHFERTVGVEIVSRSLLGLFERSAVSLQQFEANHAVHLVRSGLKAFARKLRGMLSMLNQGIIAVFSIAAALWLQPLLGATGLLFALVTIAWTARHVRRQQRGAAKSLRGERQLYERLWRLFQALPQVKLFGAGDGQLERLLEPIRRQKRGEQMVLAAERRASLEVNLAAALAGLVMLLEGAWLLADGRTSVAELTAALRAGQSVFANLRQALAFWGQAEEANDFLAALLQAQRKLKKPRANGQVLAGPIETIECRDAALAIGENALLSGVTCRLKRGRLAVVTGPSGSGKSMLLHLLGGGWATTSDPKNGALVFNGVPLAELNPTDLGRRVALVTWPPLLIEGTLAHNLRLAKPTAEDEELIESLGQAAFKSDLDQLTPLGGLKTMLGREGVQLSVGQLQRVALARALLRRPEVLLVDDLLTGLDPHSAAAVLGSLRTYARDHVVVLVAPNGMKLCPGEEWLLTERGKLLGQFSAEVAESDADLQRLLSAEARLAA